MEWTRSETIVLAANDCRYCHGLGLRADRSGQPCVCRCVYRGVFRACYRRFRYCARKEKTMSQVTLEANPRGGRKITWGRKDEEYCADFLLVARRTLNPGEWKLFNYHFLLGADANLCARRMGLERGALYYGLYRIMEKLGHVFRELKPYSLYPIDEYFNGRTESTWETTDDDDPAPVPAIRLDSLNRYFDLPLKTAA